MSVFDQPYYALTKAHMSRIGLWPDQSKYMRSILPLIMFAITLTLVGPGLIRLHNAWRDINILARNTTLLLIGIGIFFILYCCIQHFDSIELSLKKIEEHWEKFKNTPAAIVLDKYAEQGRYITVVYSTCIYVVVMLCFVLCLSPVICDFVDPVNKSRPKMYLVEADYGVDADKYYWFIIGHTYIVMMMVVSIMVAIISMYILGVVHTCTLFEVVGFADRIEEGSCAAMGVVLGIITVITVISTVQALISWKHPEVLMQQITLIIAQVLHLYIISIPGQELMNISSKIHTTAYNLGWQDMSANAQKLLILILMRSNKPCYFTAAKVYILSMETFGSAMRTVISYFMIFAQMI